MASSSISQHDMDLYQRSNFFKPRFIYSPLRDYVENSDLKNLPTYDQVPDNKAQVFLVTGQNSHAPKNQEALDMITQKINASPEAILIIDQNFKHQDLLKIDSAKIFALPSDEFDMAMIGTRHSSHKLFAALFDTMEEKDYKRFVMLGYIAGQTAGVSLPASDHDLLNYDLAQRDFAESYMYAWKEDVMPVYKRYLGSLTSEAINSMVEAKKQEVELYVINCLHSSFSAEHYADLDSSLRKKLPLLDNPQNMNKVFDKQYAKALANVERDIRIQKILAHAFENYQASGRTPEQEKEYIATGLKQSEPAKAKFSLGQKFAAFLTRVFMPKKNNLAVQDNIADHPVFKTSDEFIAQVAGNNKKEYMQWLLFAGGSEIAQKSRSNLKAGLNFLTLERAN